MTQSHSLCRCLTKWDPQALADLSGGMRDAETAGHLFQLDLSDDGISGAEHPSAIRLNVPTTLVLANLLTSRFKSLPIAVRVPKNRGLSLQLARGGVFFALANRHNVEWVEGQPHNWNSIARIWSQPYDPEDKDMYREALVTRRDLTTNAEAWVVRAAFQRYLLSVIHPHRRPATSLRRELDLIATRWLSGRLNVQIGSELATTLSDWTEVFYEIVVNVPDHASLGARSNAASLGQLYATLGGGRDSHNRLHFSVIDNGIGIPARVNKMFPEQPRDPRTALLDIVNGKLPRREAGRGAGLHRIRHIANYYSDLSERTKRNSNIWIITNGDHTDRTTTLDWISEEQDPDTHMIEDVPVHGTIVWVNLGFERRTEAIDKADQLELTYAETDENKLALTGSA